MGKFFRLLAAISLVAIAACGDKPADDGAGAPAPLTAATLGEQQVLANAEYLSQAPYVTADQENGSRQAQICRACHSLDEGGANMIGPSLYGFFGTEAGSKQDFDYSAVLAEADFTWTPRALDAWLKQPGRFLPGNRMVFAGVLNEGDRADLIAYLLRETAAETP